MNTGGENTHHVKRVVLPSGKTIEVVWFGGPDGTAGEAARSPIEPAQDLHLCFDCGSDLVYPVEWEEAGSESWSVTLRCPNCEVRREGVFGQPSVDAFDEELDRAADTLTRDYNRLLRANMIEETDRFTAALEADAILPEDF
jgi:hypothetical protein